MTKSSGEAVPAKVTVLVPIEAELIDEIAACGLVEHVVYEADLLPPARWVADHAGSANFDRSPDQKLRWERLLAETEVALGYPGDCPEGLAELVRRARGLRFVQGTAAGTGEHLDKAGISHQDLGEARVASAAGIHADQLAEWVFAAVAYLRKDLPRAVAAKTARTWADRWPSSRLRGQRILVVGTGAIGKRVLELALAYKMVPSVVTRSAADPPAGVERSATLEELAEMVEGADIVVNCLPANAQTAGCFSAPVFGRMQPGTIFVNIGRGATVSTQALERALRRGLIGGAVLDVTDPEPLPPGHPLWDAPNLVLTPHTAALADDENRMIVELFIDNLRRIATGRPLINEVRLR